MIELSEKNFKDKVNEGLVLVDFHAHWCGPCKMMNPILKEIQEEFKDGLKIYKVNVDEESSLAQRFNIMSIPTFLIFKDGQLLQRKSGFLNRKKLEKFIKKAKK